jgi:hypothetical protein
MHVASKKTATSSLLCTVQLPFIRLDVGYRQSVWCVSVICTPLHCCFPSDSFFFFFFFFFFFGSVNLGLSPNT